MQTKEIFGLLSFPYLHNQRNTIPVTLFLSIPVTLFHTIPVTLFLSIPVTLFLSIPVTLFLSNWWYRDGWVKSQKQPPRLFSKISVFPEHFFLIFPGAFFMFSPNRYRCYRSPPFFGYRTDTDFPAFFEYQRTDRHPSPNNFSIGFGR